MVSSARAGELLTFDALKPTVVRNYVESVAAQQLFDDLVRAGLPMKNESHHPGLVGLLGDAGAHLDAPPAHEIHSLLIQMKAEEQGSMMKSFVFRVEHLNGDTYHHSKGLIHDVLPNNVLDEGGTVHMYVSSPGASALGNHTDTTDVFVLHLDGEKDWIFCEEIHENDDPLSHKMNTCSTYNEAEIGTLSCERTTLYPGDALFLPRRVVHSARAPASQLSSHLTFGFYAEDTDMCSANDEDFLKNQRRRLSCNYSCDGSCDFWWGKPTSCDSGCDRDCNTSCNSGCDGCGMTCSCDDLCDGGCGDCN